MITKPYLYPLLSPINQLTLKSILRSCAEYFFRISQMEMPSHVVCNLQQQMKDFYECSS